MPKRPSRAGAAAAGLVTALVLVVLPTSDGQAARATVPQGTTGGATGAARAKSCPGRILSGMSLAQRVGQLFVAGVKSTGPTKYQRRMIRSHHLGGVILMGHNNAGRAATRRVTDRLQAQARADGVGLWVSVDQEGGYVQVLHGRGFSKIPTALAQGRLRPHTLRAHAHKWGQQLRRAGVNLNLAPVMDTVPKRLGRANKPIGYYYREYGHTPKAVAPHGMAFLRGMRSAGVQTTAKHFPGLGRVRRNTDTSYGVTDKVTTRHDAYLRPFHAAIDSSVPVVMVSAARYSEIDSRHIGLLSPTVMRGMVRGDQGFHGVIMSDSLTAAALKKVPMGRRPVRFLAAGGTVALTVQMPTIPTMTGAVLKRARNHPQFRTKVNAAARKVLQVKDRIGLLPCSPTPSPHAPCTIFGAPGKDRLVGTAHADVLCAGRGDDHIAAKGGNDVVNGGPGDDYIDGGAGDDILIGWSGADRIHGKGGSDVLRGKAGRDFLSSGGGPDKLYGGPAADTLLGWSGNDHLVGWGGADTLRGGTGRDTLHGMTGRDVLEGGYGVDTLFGDRHDDKLYGGPHNDVLHGWKGRDLLDGGRGVHDTCDGGPGNDRFRHCEG